MTLGQKQRLLAKLLPRLLDKAHELGFEVTLGDAYRDPRAFGMVGEKGPMPGKPAPYGAVSSCHKMRLAIDLNLFRDDVYLTTTRDHEPLGKFWESLDPLCTWGGRFNDANHYSITHNGCK
jgi:hypothetical protein